MAYSQNNEEEIIVKHLHGVPKGTFLDIGAYDGKTFSNTLRLVEMGWGGVCVEPSPSVFTSLLALHAENPKIELVNSAVALTRDWTTFYDSKGDAISSTSEQHKAKWESVHNVKFSKFSVMTVSLDDIFNRFGFGFEFLNLDVENTNAHLFREIPFGRMDKLRVVCVEHDGFVQEMTKITASFGFKPVGLNGENLILSR